MLPNFVLSANLKTWFLYGIPQSLSPFLPVRMTCLIALHNSLIDCFLNRKQVNVINYKILSIKSMSKFFHKGIYSGNPGNAVVIMVVSFLPIKYMSPIMVKGALYPLQRTIG